MFNFSRSLTLAASGIALAFGSVAAASDTPPAPVATTTIPATGTPALWKVADEDAKIGLPANAFDRFEPWMADLTLTVLPLVQQGYSPDAGVEKQLEGKAGAGIQRGALETVEYQIGIFDSMAAEAQIEFLIAAAEMVEETKPMLDAMVAEWLEGDADALAAIMNEEMSDPVVAEALLYKRNANWAEWIDARMEQPGTVFIAVGAGHLAGERSVQDLLAQRGLTSERVQ